MTDRAVNYLFGRDLAQLGILGEKGGLRPPADHDIDPSIKTVHALTMRRMSSWLITSAPIALAVPFS